MTLTGDIAPSLSTDIPRDMRDRDRLREEWRLIAKDHVSLDDNYQRLKEGKDIFYGELVEELITAGEKRLDAGRTARVSDAYKNYLHKMHDARRKAKDREIDMKDADRKYWEHVSQEANERTERRMSR